ncbi:MAG: Ig-like domain-containing protein [Treponemataceae bacterium]
MKKFYFLLTVFFLVACTQKESQIEVTSIKINSINNGGNGSSQGSTYPDLYLRLGRSERMNFTVEPPTASNTSLRWESDNPEVLQARPDGTLTAVSIGEAMVSVYNAAGSLLEHFSVKVTSAISLAVSDVFIQHNNITIGNNGLTLDLDSKGILFTAKIEPENAIDNSVVWTSSNPSVISINDLGVLDVRSIGTAIISAQTKIEAKNTQVTIRVTEGGNITELNIFADGKAVGNDTLFTPVDANLQLTAQFLPVGLTRDVYWSSSNPNTISVSRSGIVKALIPNESVEITAICDGVVAKAQITSIPANHVSKILLTVKDSITSSSLDLFKDEDSSGLFNFNDFLNVIILPDTAENKNLEWYAMANWDTSESAQSILKIEDKDTGSFSFGDQIGRVYLRVYSAQNQNIYAEIAVNVLLGSKGITIVTPNGKREFYLAPGKNHNMTVAFNPPDTTNQSVKWGVEDEKYATITLEGRLIASSTVTGKTKVLARSVADESQTDEVTVIVALLPTAVIFNGKEFENPIRFGSELSREISVTVLPEAATNKIVNWRTSDESIATIAKIADTDSGGTALLTPVSPGPVSIIVETDVGEVVSSREISIIKSVTELKVNGEKHFFRRRVDSSNKDIQLSVTPIPDDVSNNGVDWKSSNTVVASVNPISGKVTLKESQSGEAVITAVSKDNPSITQEFTILVGSYAFGIFDEADGVAITNDDNSSSDKARRTVTGSKQFFAGLYPDSLHYRGNATWESGDESIMTVDAATGLVTVIKPGTAELKVKLDLTGDTGIIKITCK